MKKLLIIMSALFIAVSSLSAAQVDMSKKGDSANLCEIFTKKAEVYKRNMRKDVYAKATLASYEKRAKSFCAKGK